MTTLRVIRGKLCSPGMRFSSTQTVNLAVSHFNLAQIYFAQRKLRAAEEEVRLAQQLSTAASARPNLFTRFPTSPGYRPLPGSRPGVADGASESGGRGPRHGD